MAEQFSPEYVEYILSDEAKALQEKWQELGVVSGQTVIGMNVNNWYALGLVHHHMTPSTEGDMLSGWAVSEVLSGYLHWYCNKEKQIWENWAWLPTLWQLLQIIEGAGYWWRQRLAWDGDKRYEMRIGKLTGHGHAWDAAEDDIMIAAAKLAVEALIKGG